MANDTRSNHAISLNKLPLMIWIAFLGLFLSCSQELNKRTAQEIDKHDRSARFSFAEERGRRCIEGGVVGPADG